MTVLLGRFLSLLKMGTYKMKKKQKNTSGSKRLPRNNSKNLQNLIEGNNYTIVFEILLQNSSQDIKRFKI